jgi:hypothetical protein
MKIATLLFSCDSALFAQNTGGGGTLSHFTSNVGGKGEAIRVGLYGGVEGAFGGDVAVGHARSIEGQSRIAVPVEEDEAAGAVGPFG